MIATHRHNGHPRHAGDGPANLADAFDGMRSDYAAAKNSRFKRRRQVPAAGSHADYHYRSEADFLKVMEYARDMDRNDVVVGQLVTRAVDNCVQDGITCDPQTGDEGLDREIYARREAWTKNPDECDLAGEHGYSELEWLALRQMHVDGDVLALPVQDGQLQTIEAHRVRTPYGSKKDLANIVHGVKLSQFRKRERFHVTNEDIDPMQAITKGVKFQTYDARDADGHRQVFQVYKPNRYSQTRGVSAFLPMFDVVGMFEDINFAKLVQQQVVSCFAVFYERELEFEGGAGPQQGERTTETRTDGSTQTIEGVAPGMKLWGQPGEKLTGFSPQVPNSEFFDHVRLMLTLIGCNLGMPLVLVLMDASETNFSGWRGAVDQAKLGFQRNQRVLARRFHQPIHEWKVRQWVADDAAMRKVSEPKGTEKVNPFNVKWNLPTWPYIEPLKDASADLLRVRNALTSPRRLHAEHGRDWEEVADEIVADNSYAILAAKTAAKEINAKFPEDETPVTWREIISLPTPDGVTISLAPGQDDESSRKPAGAAKDGRDAA